jgi:flagellar hook-basal body complex protein FliE
MLSDAIYKINTFQSEAESLAKKFEKGDSSINLAEVMIAVQKAELSLQAMSQVRNKLVSAYQEIINMPI